MISDRYLYFAGLFFSFSLQIAAGYLTCALLTRTFNRPRQRFRIWIAFLCGSIVYWTGLLAWQWQSFAGHASAEAAGTANTSGSSSLFLVPLSWSPAILVIAKFVVGAYVSILAFLFGVSAWRQMRLRILLRRGWAAPAAINSLFQQIREELGVSRCELVMLPGLASPATAGWLRPRVLLPAICEDLEERSRLADVLHHELEHVARRDYFWASFNDLVCRILFFHPAVWHARKQARFQGELACDLAVVEARPDRRADYADSLAYFVRLRMIEQQAAVGIDFAASACSLSTRIRLILAGSPGWPWWKRVSHRAASLAIVSAFALTAPALVISVSFFHPLSESFAPSMTQAFASSPSVPGRHRAHAVDIDRQVKLPPVADLNAMRVGNSFSAGRSYSMTRTDTGKHGESSSDENRPWRESNPSLNHPSVISVIRDSVAIAVARGDHDDDREHKTSHFAPQ